MEGASDGTAADASAEYVFGATVRIEPSPHGVRVDPERFETRIYRRANRPGENGWLFFRDNLWRGELNDPAHFRELTEDALGTPVESVDFRELRTTQSYLDALHEEIDANLELFSDESATAVVSKFLGSSIRVVEE